MTTSLGDDDLLDLLMIQHQRIRSLLRQVAETTGRARRQAFDDLVRVMAIHESVEQQVIHPHARTVLPTGDTVVAQRLAEEHQITNALGDLYELGPEHPDFEDQWAALQDAVLEHDRREERIEYPALRRNLSADQLILMGQALDLAAEQIPEGQDGQDTPLAVIVGGPPTAMFERAREGLRGWE